MKSIHTFDVFAPTDEQEEAMNKKRGGHYRRGKNKEMDYFIECATSLFPNNHYSRFTPIYDTTKEFYQLITSSDTTERAILNWIASNRAWNYLFGLLRHYYRTGHHDDNYIFPEFKIGSAYVADYLLIGNSSDGYQFVFVELEAPNGRITKEKGTRFGEVINKGIEQVRDWQMYIAANWNVIVAELEKHSFSNTKLPRQLYKYCPYQIYYTLYQLWTHESVKEYYAFVNKDVKRQINDLYRNSENVRINVSQGMDQSVGITVQRIVSDFGTLNLVLDRHMDVNTMLIVNLDQVQIAELRGTFFEMLPCKGDSEKGHVMNESSIKLLDSYSGVKIINIPVIATENA